MEKEKSNRWCFTCWDFNSIMWWKAYKMHLVEVMVVGRETCPTTKKLHFQGYVEWRKPYDLSSCKRLWADRETHWEIARSDAKACLRYCCKEGDLIINHNCIGKLIQNIQIGKFLDFGWDEILEESETEGALCKRAPSFRPYIY